MSKGLVGMTQLGDFSATGGADQGSFYVLWKGWSGGTGMASFTCLMPWLGWLEGRARLALCTGHRHVLYSMVTPSVVRFLDLGLTVLFLLCYSVKGSQSPLF